VAGGKIPVSAKCTPASGSSFPVGSTTVSCTVTDVLNRSASCQFAVTVTTPPPSVAGYTISGAPPMVGATSTYSGMVTMSSGATQPVSPSSAQWFSSNSQIAAWSSPGVLQGVAPGTTAVQSVFSGLTATQTVTIAAGSVGSFTLSWGANPASDNVSAYEVDFGTTSGVYSTAINVGTVTTYTLTNLQPGTTYFFSVRAFNGQWGPYSAEASATTP
jgi:hypothetical protein